MGTLLNQLLGNTKVVHEFYDPHFEYLTEASEDTVAVSYTHLDVYKRQLQEYSDSETDSSSGDSSEESSDTSGNSSSQDSLSLIHI